MIGDEDHAERWRSKSMLGFTPMVTSPWRFQARLIELWDEGDSELIGGRSWDELALEALSSTLDELEQRFGHDPAGWTWGRVHGLRFPHALSEGKGEDVEAARPRAFAPPTRRRRRRRPSTRSDSCPHDGDYTGAGRPRSGCSPTSAGPSEAAGST